MHSCIPKREDLVREGRYRVQISNGNGGNAAESARTIVIPIGEMQLYQDEEEQWEKEPLGQEMHAACLTTGRDMFPIPS